MEPQACHAVVSDGPAWGLGDARTDRPVTHLLPLPEVDLEPAGWLAALAVAVCRYDGDDSDGTAVIALDGGAVEVSPAGTGAELIARRPVPTDRPAGVGLILDAAGGPTGVAYVPCLAPPYPLTVSVCRTAAGGAALRVDHRPRYVSAPIAEAFARHVAYVHRQLRQAPDRPVDRIDLLDEAETAAVAALGRPKRPLISTPVSLPVAFRHQAAATPDAVALTDGVRTLTYRELDERSDRIATGLRADGVRAGDRVGICLERDVDLVATIIGVHKAGAAYVPVDPVYPAERLAYTAQDAGVGVVVTRLAEFPNGARAVTPDALAAHEPQAWEPPGPDDAAYIIYTSGSTGRPKGVVVAHRNVISLVDATREEYGFGPHDTWSLFHSSAFDVSVWEIWGCLLNGGRLVVVPQVTTRDPEGFHALLRDERVTVLSQTPSAFSQLLGRVGDELAVRLIVFAGEPLDARMLLPWFDRYPESRCRVVNMYGITETTVHSTETTVRRGDALAASRSVGTALPGWTLYVLDQAGRMVPPGVSGEIYVGGAGVAEGYHERPDLTQARFLPDPFSGGRMYRSGDRGRMRPDGQLEHHGRLDGQVKIRGFRIELDEIRSVLLECPDVTAAAVVVRRQRPEDPASARLDAYVVGPDDTDTAGVRKRVATILPDYMVPATVTVVPALPLTTNGKLDRARLPEPTRSATVSGMAAVPGPAADSGMAAAVCAVWSAVLGTEVGLDDDFFELGGNSLLAVRLGTALRERGLPSVPLRTLYLDPTVRGVVNNTAGMTRKEIMKFRTIGQQPSTQRRVSALSLGAMTFGTTVDEATSFAILDRFVEAGGTFIDTSNNYAFWADAGQGGQSEELLGRWLRGRGKGDDLVIATKVGARPRVPGLSFAETARPENIEGLSAKAIRQAAAQSRERLGVEKIDLLYAHVEDTLTPLAETVEGFADLVNDGTVGLLGASNHWSWRLERARAIAAAAGLPGYEVVQYHYSYLRPRTDLSSRRSADGNPGIASGDLIAYLREEPGLTLVAYSALLGGGYTRDDKPLSADFAHEGTPKRLAAARAVAAETGATVNQVVLAWMIGADLPIVPLISASSVAQIEESLGALDLELTADQRARLNAAN